MIPAHSDVHSVVPVAEELIARGHQVTFYLTEEFAPAVRRVGAAFQPLDPAVDLYDQLSSGNPLTAMADVGKVIERMGPLVANLLVEGLRAVPDMVGAVRAEDADCVVYNPMCPWGIALAQLLGLPSITFSTTFVMKPGSDFEQMFSTSASADKMANIWSHVRRSVDELHTSYGVPSLRLSDMFSPDEDLNIVPLIREFQPEADSLDERYLFVGPSIRPGGDRVDFPLDQLAAGPNLYISLGTAVSRGSGSGFTEICFDAFGSTNWQVVLATGRGTDPASLGTPPANFLVRSHVPQLDVLERADVFVTHGGVNSVMEAVWYGVPLIAIPHTIEQLMFADRAAQLGLGSRLDPADVTASTLRDAVLAVTADSGYRIRLAGLSAAAKKAGGYQKAADAIEEAVIRSGAAVGRHESSGQGRNYVR